MADGAKFAAFSAEVMGACEQYQPGEVDRAGDTLVRMKTRPHIGDVYDALDKARETASPTKPQTARSLQSDVTIAVAWLAGSTVRYADFPAEFNQPDHLFPFVPRETLAQFARGIDHGARSMIARLDSLTHAPRHLRPTDSFEAEIVRRLRWAKDFAGGYDRRLAEIAP